jgi:elongation factor Tu
MLTLQDLATFEALLKGATPTDEALGALRTAAAGNPGMLALIDMTARDAPRRGSDEPFLLAVEDVFTVSGRGTVVTGSVETGAVRVGETVECVGFGTIFERRVSGIEMVRKPLDQAQAGDNISLLLPDITRADVERGHVVAAPGTIAAHKGFGADIYLLTKEEGGRRTPIVSGHALPLWMRTVEVIGDIILPTGVPTLAPGESSPVRVALKTPMPLRSGDSFVLREGARMIGAGVITAI